MLIYLAWIGVFGGTAKTLVDSMWTDENSFCVFLIDHLQGDM
jgi:hypothetical protein